MRRESANQKVFSPFKIVIETRKERNILTSLVARTSELKMQQIANAWGVNISEVRFILTATEDILQEKEGS